MGVDVTTPKHAPVPPHGLRVLQFDHIQTALHAANLHRKRAAKGSTKASGNDLLEQHLKAIAHRPIAIEICLGEFGEDGNAQGFAKTWGDLSRKRRLKTDVVGVKRGTAGYHEAVQADARGGDRDGFDLARQYSAVARCVYVNLEIVSDRTQGPDEKLEGAAGYAGGEGPLSDHLCRDDISAGGYGEKALTLWPRCGRGCVAGSGGE